MTCSSSGGGSSGGGGGGVPGAGVGGSHLHARSTPGTLSSLNASASASSASGGGGVEGSPHQRYSVLLSASLSALTHSGLDHFTTPQLASLAELLPLSGPQRALVPRKFWGVFVEEVQGRCARGEVVPSPHAHTLPPILLQQRQHQQQQQQQQQGGGQGQLLHPHPLAMDESSIAWATDAVCLLHALSRMSPLAPPTTTTTSSTTSGTPLLPASSNSSPAAAASPASLARGILLDLVAHEPAASSRRSTATSPLSLAAASSPAILEQLAYSVGMLYRSGSAGAGAGVPVRVLDAVGSAVLAARPESLSTEALWEVLLLFDKGGVGGGNTHALAHTHTRTHTHTRAHAHMHAHTNT